MKRFAFFLIIVYVFYIFLGINLSVLAIEHKNNLHRIDLYDGIMVNPICPNFSADITTKEDEVIMLNGLDYFFGQLRFRKSDTDYSKCGVLSEFKGVSFEFHIVLDNGETQFRMGIPISVLSAILHERILTVDDFFKNYEKIENFLLELPAEMEIPFEIDSGGKILVFSIRRSKSFLQFWNDE